MYGIEVAIPLSADVSILGSRLTGDGIRPGCQSGRSTVPFHSIRRVILNASTSQRRFTFENSCQYVKHRERPGRDCQSGQDHN
jgi:hypothetical protein